MRLLEGSEKWAGGSNRHPQTLSFIMALEADHLLCLRAERLLIRCTFLGSPALHFSPLTLGEDRVCHRGQRRAQTRPSGCWEFY